MRRTIATLLLAALALTLVVGTQLGSAKPTPKMPKGFFGIAPQTVLTDRDMQFMKAGGLESMRVPLVWSQIQPTPTGGYDWSGTDATVALAARRGIQVLPFFFGTPPWLAKAETTMPIDNGRARRAWTAFVGAAVKRYGPGGEFWRERAPGVVQYEPAISRPLPIRNWQIWNEANFFYFAFPVSAGRYARLLRLTAPVIKKADRGAQIVLTGLFGEPTTGPRKGISAAKFLRQLYRVPGIKAHFDAIALHPYAIDAKKLEELVEELHEVAVENRDRPSMFVTEMGWGSENNFRNVAFEQGPRGQVRQLRNSYRYLMENQRRLNLKQVYWYSWKDLEGSCSFCDSVGLFRAGPKFHPKPSWRAFVRITGGRARP